MHFLVSLHYFIFHSLIQVITLLSLLNLICSFQNISIVCNLFSCHNNHENDILISKEFFTSFLIQFKNFNISQKMALLALLGLMAHYLEMLKNTFSFSIEISC